MSFLQFSEWVKKRRLSLELSQQALAKKMGVRKATIQRIENASVYDVEASTLFALGEALKWTPEQLYKAYHGKDPSAKEVNEQYYKEVIEKLIHSLPEDLVLEILKDGK